jgi:uncharacterized DUF497 family protein
MAQWRQTLLPTASQRSLRKIDKNPALKRARRAAAHKTIDHDVRGPLPKAASIAAEARDVVTAVVQELAYIRFADVSEMNLRPIIARKSRTRYDREYDERHNSHFLRHRDLSCSAS